MRELFKVCYMHVIRDQAVQACLLIVGLLGLFVRIFVCSFIHGAHCDFSKTKSPICMKFGTHFTIYAKILY